MSLVALEPRSDAFVQQALERHQRRREEQGIPTLTVLVGRSGHAMTLLRRWLEPRRRLLCTVVAEVEVEVVRAWVETLVRERNVRADAADFLGACVGLAPGELRTRLEGRTTYERDVVLQEFLPLAPDGDATAVCKVLLQLSTGHAGGLLFSAVLAACNGEPARVLAALHTLVPAGTAPALLLTGVEPTWFARAARTAARLCDAVPLLPLALNTERPAVDSFLGSSETQAHAMVREGLIGLEAPSPVELRRRLEAHGVRHADTLSDSLSGLAEDGVSEELLAQFAKAARGREAAASNPAEADGARSEAERFLRMMLDEFPDTHGLFELNKRAKFRIHNRPVEVDFLSDLLRVAIEIDGYYHFRGPEAYRRDRRKDLELQLHGYLVLRFLADDVVARWREIRDTLRQVVSRRRDLARVPPPLGEDADGGG
ncbi:endonuclease domain-containing protein [Hyalangium rubrum]|uniref:DUF559 domain-containing protein n=1 Tax=Hyalangium rubrum TaxID=3103134 RepID=A0ABU5GZD4_9BACT|nr:DUF559 domain-containing protein [Hyalangium sp. s54d21]MDY7225897.1 DUF559 domain-containing protein [Hyalangium sp. s54d21]